MSREHRRAKTDRLDTELLMRAFLGWLRGERRHCSMAAIPTIGEEDAKRPNREHEKLVGDRTRIMNRMKSTLSRFGIRGFKPTLRKADEKLPPKERFCLAPTFVGAVPTSVTAPASQKPAAKPATSDTTPLPGDQTTAPPTKPKKKPNK